MAALSVPTRVASPLMCRPVEGVGLCLVCGCSRVVAVDVNVVTRRTERNTFFGLVITFFGAYIGGMTKAALFQLRLGKDDHARWHDAARRADVSLAEYVRLAVEARIASGEADELRERIARAIAALEGPKP